MVVPNNFFKELTPEEEKDYRNFVIEDEQTVAFIKKVSFYHPVIRDEICKQISKNNTKEYIDEKYDTLLDAVNKKDQDAIERFNKASRTGKVVRIM
jgi:hypothetical protein